MGLSVIPKTRKNLCWSHYVVLESYVDLSFYSLTFHHVSFISQKDQLQLSQKKCYAKCLQLLDCLLPEMESYRWESCNLSVQDKLALLCLEN